MPKRSSSYSYRRRTYKRKPAKSDRTLAMLQKQLAPTSFQRAMAMKKEFREHLYGGYRKANPDAYATELAQVAQKYQFDFPRAQKIMGNGGYWGKRIGGWLGGLTGNRTIKDWGASLGDAAGDYIASRVPYGNAIAAGAQGIAQLTGHGAYNVNDNMSIQPASFGGGDVESVTVRAREYIGAVEGSINFTQKKLRINPGDLSTFPRLAKMAQNFEQYKFNGLVLIYHSTSGETTVGTNTAIGEVIMAVNPNSSAAAPQNKAQLVRMDSASQSKPSMDAMCGVECKDELNDVKYIRHGEPTELGGDFQTYDIGSFYVATEGMAGANRIGELWVSYDVTLIRARDTKGQEVAAFSCKTQTATQAALLNSTTSYYTNTLNIEFGNTNTFAFPDYLCDGDYQVVLTMRGSLDATGQTTNYQVRFPAATFYLCTNLYGTSAIEKDQTYAVPGSMNASLIQTATYRLRINAPGASRAYIAFDTSALWPGLSAPITSGILEVVITEIPSTLFPAGYLS